MLLNMSLDGSSAVRPENHHLNSGSQSELWTSSISTIWELVTSANPEAHPTPGNRKFGRSSVTCYFEPENVKTETVMKMEVRNEDGQKQLSSLPGVQEAL